MICKSVLRACIYSVLVVLFSVTAMAQIVAPCVDGVQLSGTVITSGSVPYQSTGDLSASSGVSINTDSSGNPTGNATVTFRAAGQICLGAGFQVAATPAGGAFDALIGAPVQQPQTISFNPLSNRTFGDAPFTVSAAATSGLLVSVASITSSVCAVSEATVTLLAAGTCTIQATQGGNIYYLAATPVNQSFIVTSATQTITFPPLNNVMLGSSPLVLTATSSSGLVVSYTSTTPSVCAIASGNTAVFLLAGICTIQATQAGNANYSVASPVTRSLTVIAQVATPTFSPGAGTYSSQQTVTISSTPGATIMYSLDGSDPSRTTGSVYGGPVLAPPVGLSATLKAFAYMTNMADSATAQAVYNLNLPMAATPTLFPTPGAYTGAQSVAIQSSTPNAAIYYTTDGTTPTTASRQYVTGTTVPVNITTTLKAIATAANFQNSTPVTGVYTITAAVETPTVNPPYGAYTSAQTVTLTSTAGSTIYYTTDGTLPSQTHGTAITSPGTVSVAASEPLYAVAYKVGMASSNPVEGNFVISAVSNATGLRDYIRLGSRVVAIESMQAVASPTFSVYPGTYSSPQSVYLNTTTAGASIRYTTDGVTIPSETAGILYDPNQPIAVNATTTIRAIAYKTGLTDSALVIGAYTIILQQAASPTFSVSPGIYSSPQYVSLSTTTPGASIRYTTDGVTTPSETVGTLYNNSYPIYVSVPTAIKAIAYKAGMADSTPVTGTYTIVTVSVIGPTTMPLGGTGQFYATVTGTTNQAVTWQAAYGTITTNGAYTAPTSAPPGGSDSVTATSVVNSGSSYTLYLNIAQATITVSPNYPSYVFLSAGESLNFSATVVPSFPVTWTAGPVGMPLPPYGTVTSTGYYTAPSSGFSSTILNAVSASVGSAADFSVVAIDPVATPRIRVISPINQSGPFANFNIQVTGGSYPASTVYLYLNSSLTEGTGSGCLIQINSNGAYLVGDDSYAFNGSSYCTVTSGSFSSSGNNATIALAVSFSTPWQGSTQNVYATVVNSNGNSDPSGWQTMGWWNIP